MIIICGNVALLSYDNLNIMVASNSSDDAFS